MPPPDTISLAHEGSHALKLANHVSNLRLPLPAVFALPLASCAGSPSRNILGSYFPSWMICALLGVVVALSARLILRSTGLLQELPAPFIVLLAIATWATFAIWLVWLA